MTSLKTLLACFIAFMALTFGALFWAVESWKAELPAQYAAWSKHTSNPGNLTFEEWNRLPRGTK